MHLYLQVFGLSVFGVNRYVEVSDVPTGVEAGPELVSAWGQPWKAEFSVCFRAASRDSSLLRAIFSAVREIFPKVFGMGKNLDEGAISRAAIRRFNCPAQVLVGALLNDNDHLISAPASRFVLFCPCTLAVAGKCRSAN